MQSLLLRSLGVRIPLGSLVLKLPSKDASASAPFPHPFEQRLPLSLLLTVALPPAFVLLPRFRAGLRARRSLDPTQLFPKRLS